MSSLAGLHIVVTRPLPQAEAFIQLLKQEGADVVYCPTMTITPFIDEKTPEYQAIKTSVMELDSFESVICISVSSATYALEWVDAYWPQLPLGVNWHAVGKSTAAVLSGADIDVSYPDQVMDSGGLLKRPSLQEMKNKKVLLFKGRGGRDVIKTELQFRGANVVECDLYERCLAEEGREPLVKALNTGRVTLITSHSGEMIENALTLVKASESAATQLLHTALVVPGERVAKKAKLLGFKDVVVSQNATSEVMLSTVQQWWQQAKQE